MKRIDILSDTHGLLRPEVISRLAGADLILHAGDIDTQTVADELSRYGALCMVRGNNDGMWAEHIPEHRTVTIEDLRFFVVHNRRDVPRELSDVDVVVYGHSHVYAAEVRNGVLWLNPGSCGRRRFGQELSFCMMEAEHGSYRFEKITIPPEGRTSL